MKAQVHIYPFLLFLFLVQAGYTQPDIWLVDPLEPIYPDTNTFQKYGDKYAAAFPLGAPAEVHLMVKMPLGTTVSLSARMDGKELPADSWAVLRDVPVEQNTGLDSRTEQFINQINPYVIRRAPFRIYEVIEPLSEGKFQIKNRYQAFRLQIPAARFPAAGKYRIAISVASGAGQWEGAFTAQLFDGNLPGLSAGHFFYTNWFNLKRMEEQHDVERWSPAWFDMLDQYARLMAHGRQNSITVPGELLTWDGEKFSLDSDRLLQFINVFRKYGFQYFESPHLLYRGDGDDWSSPELVVHLTKNGYFSEAGKKDIAEIIRLIKTFTEKNNLKDNWLQHIADEPTSSNAACYKAIVQQVKSIYPEITIMEATNDRDGLAGAIDLWCPLINDFQENEAFFRSREQEGEQVLVYTCLIPGGPWLNRTLDMERLRQVYFGWGGAHYNTSGYLHWGLNQYHAGPFEQSVVHHPSPVATANNFLPAGDTHIVYPGKTGPLSSARFEAHRIGIEDFELLRLFKAEKPKAHERLVKKLFRSYTDYELSVKKYRKVRKRLLRKVEGGV